MGRFGKTLAVFAIGLILIAMVLLWFQKDRYEVVVSSESDYTYVIKIDKNTGRVWSWARGSYVDNPGWSLIKERN